MKKITRRNFLKVATIATATIAISACGEESSSAVSNSESTSSSSTGETEQEITTIRFYGSDAEYNQNIVSGFEALNPDVKVEIVPVDFDNAEQVIKTGIIADDPVDVSFFWGTQINAFTEDGMALDLTDYLTANNNEWKDIFVPAYIDGGMVDGRYYAVSYQPVIETIFYNKSLFEQFDVKVPTTWQELLDACETLKANDVYGIGNWNGQNHQLMQFSYQYMANDGTIEDYTSGSADFTACEGIKKGLADLKEIYDSGYWYPGEGALTSTKDQTQAAWYQGKIAMLVDAGSNAGEYETNCEFEVGILPFPYVEEGGLYAVNVVTNALFVPVNAKHPEEAVRFMKYYTSDAGIAEIIASGRLPSTIAMQGEVDSEVLQALLATTVGDNVIGYKHIQGLSSEMNAYIQHDLVGAVCTGTSIDDALQQMEDLRLTAIG